MEELNGLMVVIIIVTIFNIIILLLHTLIFTYCVVTTYSDIQNIGLLYMFCKHIDSLKEQVLFAPCMRGRGRSGQWIKGSISISAYPHLYVHLYHLQHGGSPLNTAMQLQSCLRADGSYIG